MSTETNFFETRPDGWSEALVSGRQPRAPSAGRPLRLSLAAVALGLLMLPVLAGGALAEDKPAAAHVAAAEPKPGATQVDYRPPERGAPESRVAGSTRGFGAGDLHLAVLAPLAGGWTSKAQPTLFWFMSQRVETVEIVVADEDAIDPLVDRSFSGRFKAGINQVALGEFGPIELKPGIEYKWSVIAVIDGEEQSRNPVASGTLRRVAMAPSLSASIAGASPEQLPALYAADGYWYDSIEALAQLMAKRPDDPSLHRVRDAMLRGEGLTDAAAFDSHGG